MPGTTRFCQGDTRVPLRCFSWCA